MAPWLSYDSMDSNDLHARLWDVETMAVVQSINMPSFMYVTCCLREDESI